MSAEGQDVIGRMQAALAECLEGRCAEAIIQRMQAQLDKIAKLGWSVDSTLQGIRTALRLFVGEDVADEVHQQLTALAGPATEA